MFNFVVLMLIIICGITCTGLCIDLLKKDRGAISRKFYVIAIGLIIATVIASIFFGISEIQL